jgi:5-methyltetrahydropteroyltriglutamate--homocysteine methyltransferase
MPIPTEPIGSIPRPPELIEGMQRLASGQISGRVQKRTTARCATRFAGSDRSPIITDGEQTKPSFVTYPIHGMEGLALGVTIPFADGHTRQLPRLTTGPFRYRTYAVTYLEAAQRHASVPVKQAVIAASALSLLYPPEGIPDYSRDAFLADLLREAERDIRQCLTKGAANVQVDFTEGRLAVKLDPSKQLLRSFVDLNNRVFDRFSPEERTRLGVHTCGGDRLNPQRGRGLRRPVARPVPAGSGTCIQLASETDRPRVLRIIMQYATAGHGFRRVTDRSAPRRNAEEVRPCARSRGSDSLSQLG